MLLLLTPNKKNILITIFDFFIGFIALSCIHNISFKLKSKHEHYEIKYP